MTNCKAGLALPLPGGQWPGFCFGGRVWLGVGGFWEAMPIAYITAIFQEFWNIIGIPYC